jgi:hypothetical protein
MSHTELPLPTECFSVSKLQTFVKMGIMGRANAVEYVSQYYFESTNGGAYYKFNPITNDFEFKERIDFKNEVLNKIDEDKVLMNYFKKNAKIYEVVCEIYKPRHYQIGDQYFLNLCQGLLHKNVNPYNEYPESIKESVKVMLDFMLEIDCNNDLQLFNAYVKWWGQVVKGQRTEVIIYKKSPEGTGKSTHTDFIREFVIGEKVSVSPSTECLTSNFNKCLMGQILVVFEELPVFSAGQWAGVSTKIKGYATNPTMQFRDLYEKSIVAKNVFNCIIQTNVEAIKNSDQRRIVIMPINTRRIKDYSFFTKVRSECFNMAVGEAFYAYLLSIDVSKFVAQRDFPLTEQKQNMISQLLPATHKFLKSYILSNTEIGTVKPKDLYDDFKSFCEKEKLKFVQLAEFTQSLKDVQIENKKTSALDREGIMRLGTNFYTITLAHLKTIAVKHHWNSDLDDTEEGNIELVSVQRSDYDEFLQWKELQAKTLVPVSVPVIGPEPEPAPIKKN